MGEDCMESPCHLQRFWYAFSDDLPEGELVVPVKNEYGLAFAVRRDAGITQEMLDQLNAAADFVLGVGLAHLDVERTDTPPERKE
jgi:hypothetical protein